ncbi:hypothetical protein ZIOFF_027157 [Zingiber officinale]|uniref:Uncharacterized protein n=2 Tax=Zingiber officinale TaxID=94328 RepID=A0A8J5HFL6_ZINOF|nr:hypothetical protein ZIOFF_027157 [Zingiber officinale]
MASAARHRLVPLAMHAPHGSQLPGRDQPTLAGSPTTPRETSESRGLTKRKPSTAGDQAIIAEHAVIGWRCGRNPGNRSWEGGTGERERKEMREGKQNRRLVKLDSRNPAPIRPPPVTSTLNRPPSPRNWNNIPRPNISPALYVIPESTPLPCSPSSFSPASPYIINHKRRGPRLLKSVTQSDAGGKMLPQLEPKAESAAPNGTYAKIGDINRQEIGGEQKPGASSGGEVESNSSVVELHQVKPEDGFVDNRPVRSDELARPGSLDLERDKEINDFFDPNGSVSSYSNNELGRNPSTPSGEYFDAFEEISSDGTSQSSSWKFEELRDLRLNISMEIERCKQAEEATEALQNQWQMLSDHLSSVGLQLPAPSTFPVDDIEQPDIDPAEDLCQQIVVSHFVADAIERVVSSAEEEMVMEPLIESKNFEIARLQDRLQYYETANREMSQRNRKALELAREQRNMRKRRQRWIWSSIGLAATVIITALAWSYHPLSRSSSAGEGNATESHRE